eukprot:scaffold2968_cov321-Pinguiococcus_pyrenoidosus.AAC.15
MGKYQALAVKHDMWLSLGGFHEIAEHDAQGAVQRVFNTHVVLAPDGVLRPEMVYRKIHLFDVAIPGGAILQESRTTKPGQKAVVVDTPFGLSLGLTTCYDLRFPELYASLVARGANVLLVPSAFTVPTGRAHWELLLRARAVETQCYVLAAAQVGRHNGKRQSWGQAIAIDPWGAVLDSAPSMDDLQAAEGAGADVDEDVTSLLIADLSMELLDAVRVKMPLQNHRDAASWT